MVKKDMCYKYADFVIRNYNQKYPLSNKRLQKILFVATALYANKTGEKLFDDDFYAWNYGPVMPIIYSQYAKFQEGYMKPLSLSQEKLDDLKKRVLLKALEETKNISTDKLIENSHAKNSPWGQTYSGKTIKLITFDSIKDYYSSNKNLKELLSY